MEKYGEAYKIYGRFNEFCRIIEEKGFYIYGNPKKDHSVQVMDSSSNQFLGIIYNKEMFVLNGKKKSYKLDKPLKKKFSNLEKLAKEF